MSDGKRPFQEVMGEIDAACVADFVNDLADMSDVDIERERSTVSDQIDNETSWLEALCAEQRIRTKKRSTSDG